MPWLLATNYVMDLLKAMFEFPVGVSQKDRTVCCYFDDEFLQILGGYACLSSISHRHSSILGMLLQQKKTHRINDGGGHNENPQ